MEEKNGWIMTHLKALMMLVLGAFLISSLYSSVGLEKDFKDIETTKRKFVSEGKYLFSDKRVQVHPEIGQEALAESCYAFACNLRADMEHDKEAFVLMEQAANFGSIDAQHDLAVMLKNGTGCSKDLKKAVYWYDRSANKGYALAENNLGALYEFGDEGIERDYDKALDLYKRATDHGLELGRTNLERLLDELDQADREEEAKKG